MKLRQLFESHLTDHAEIKAWLDSMGITNYEIRNSWVVVDDKVNLYKKGLTSIPVKFRAVSGGFDCSDNKLTSLVGAPREVGGSFFCPGNKLTSLAGAPREVGGDFYCHGNKLTSLAGAPREVGGGFYCSHNNLTSLVGAPREVGRDFYCPGNNLTSLDFDTGTHIGGDLVVDDKLIKSPIPDGVIIDGQIR